MCHININHGGIKMEFLVFFSIIVLGLLAIDPAHQADDAMGFSVNLALFAAALLQMVIIHQKYNTQMEDDTYVYSPIPWLIDLINTHFDDPLRDWQAIHQTEGG
jgi:hypothetical protein